MIVLFLWFVCFNNPVSNNLESLVNAELNFSKLSQSNGIREAFVTYLADDAIVFRPNPVQGKKLYEERSDIPGLLKWEPEYAEIAYSGEIGYTTGPYIFQRDSLVDYGHYISIWKKNKKGAWMVWVDGGISHEKPTSFPEKINFTSKNVNSFEKSNFGNIIQLDTLPEFSAPEGYKSLFGDNSRILREGLFPIIGKEKVVDFINTNFHQFKLIPDFSYIAKSNDLEFTYGTGKMKIDDEEKTFGYLRIWKRISKEKWKITLEYFSKSK